MDKQIKKTRKSHVRPGALWKDKSTWKKRDFLIDVLLLGTAETRQTLIKKIGSVFAYSSILDNSRVVGRYVQFLIKLGVLELVGENQFRIKPHVLEALKTEKGGSKNA